MSTDRWQLLSEWHNAWLAAGAHERDSLRRQFIEHHPDLAAQANALASASAGLQGFLETPALALAARDLAEDDPLLDVDTLVGPYRIVGLMARGGMGDVYRATDVRLQRDVALKLLAHAGTDDTQRIERFLQEARVTAALDHANIVKVFDVGVLDGRPYLVAELLEGETLRLRLGRGPLAAEEATRIAGDVAAGLVVAHAAGLVHRDLKPDNVFLTRSGVTKILDFGIAKLTDGPAVADGLATLTGVLLGTAGYLAPEQIRGDAVDGRTDLFALGSMLFEMSTGQRAFAREHTIDTLHAILHDAPPDRLQAAGVSPELTAIVMRLLEKAPAARFQSAADVEWALGYIASTRTAAGGAAEPSARRRERPAWMTAAALLLGAAALLGIATGSASWLGGHWPPAHRESAVARLSLKIEGDTAENLRLPVDRFFTPFTLSPDGTRLVFRARGNGRAQLFLRELSGFETRPIPGTEMATTPFFSPDGHWIGFWRAEDRILRKVSLAGGSPIEIAQTDAPIVALWTSNDEIVIESGDQHGELWSIPASGGTPKAIAVRDRSDGELISLRGRYLVAVTFSSQALATAEPGSTCCRVRRERDDDCCAAAATSWRATPGRAISCSRTETRYGPCL